MEQFELGELCGVICPCGRCVRCQGIIGGPREYRNELGPLAPGCFGYMVQLIPGQPPIPNPTWLPETWFRKIPPLNEKAPELEAAGAL